MVIIHGRLCNINHAGISTLSIISNEPQTFGAHFTTVIPSYIFITLQSFILALNAKA